jgi:peptide subunit release factor RF-3
MNLIPDKQAAEISSISTIPEYFATALVNDGAAKVFNAYQKKADGSRLPWAVVAVDDSVTAFLKSDKATGFVFKIIYNLNYDQFALVAQDNASLEVGQQLWNIHLINSK